MTNTKRTKRVQKEQHNYSVRLALLFFALVGGLVFLSLAAKFLVIINKSTFDNQHRFTIVVLPKNTDRADVISFAPKIQSIALLHADGAQDSSHIGRLLEIPIDGTIQTSALQKKATDTNIADVMRGYVFGFAKIKTNLTIIDLVRLWFFALPLPSHAVTQKTLSFEKTSDLTDLSIDKVSSGLFADETITQEKISIQIVNATDVAGLGSRFARLAGNMGGNVVSVTTAEKQADSTVVQYYGKKTYTVSRLEKILGVTSAPMQNPAIADIIVTLGKDRGKATAF